MKTLITRELVAALDAKAGYETGISAWLGGYITGVAWHEWTDQVFYLSISVTDTVAMSGDGIDLAGPLDKPDPGIEAEFRAIINEGTEA